MNLTNLKSSSSEDLEAQAKALDIRTTSIADKSQLILEILRAHTKSGGAVTSSGTLEILGDGFGFLRGSSNDLTPSPQDIYVSPSQIRRFHLNTGDFVAGQVRPPKESERYFALLRVETINSAAADKAMTSQGFSERAAVHCEQLLEFGLSNKTSSLFDQLCPIGKGQRVLLLAPPRCRGDEVLLKIALAARNHQDDYDLTTMVIAQRPEFVRDYHEARPGKFVSSFFDDPPQRHSQITDVVIENAKRAADQGQDILLLVDSLSRLASAASQSTSSNSLVLPGGLTPKGLQTVRRLFGAGRNLKDAGSITVVALLRDSGSALDDYLRQELSDSANACIQLAPFKASKLNKAASNADSAALPLALESCWNLDEERFLDDAQREECTNARAQFALAGPRHDP